METIYALGATLLLGIAIGFIINDTERISLQEIKISTTVFVVLNLIIAVLRPDLIPMLLQLFLLGWIVICLGLVLGDCLRLHVVKRIMDGFLWRDMEQTIVRLITASALYVKDRDQDQKRDVERLTRQLERESTAWLARNEDKRLRELVALCLGFTQISHQIVAEDRPECRELLISSWQEIGGRLMNLASPVIRQAAEDLRCHLTNVWHLRRTDLDAYICAIGNGKKFSEGCQPNLVYH